MIPAARLSAAIEVLDRVLAGASAEQVLTHWGRSNRYAGSGDRAAVRDLVFEALRCRRSFGALGENSCNPRPTGRSLILGGQRAATRDIDSLFTGQGHAPARVEATETGREPTRLEAIDCPDWLAPDLQISLGEDFAAVMQALKHRAPTFLRVNLARLDRNEAIARLAEEGIIAEPVDLVRSALQVTENARKIQMSQPYAQGLVELQDASSQAVVAALPLQDGMSVLDYCAGGGGKTLAMAAQAKLTLHAYDANPRRMSDLPKRAERAGMKVRILSEVPRTSFDLVLTDVPCSGSGSWRRDPEGKWALDRQGLNTTLAVQAEIMNNASQCVGKNGFFSYATCSVLAEENEEQVKRFLHENPEWTCLLQKRFSPLDGGDGFFLAVLQRRPAFGA